MIHDDNTFFQSYQLVQNMKHKHPLVFGHLTDLLPLWEEEDQHDHDLLKHHDEDVESTLTHPGTALNRITCANIRNTTLQNSGS